MKRPTAAAASESGKHRHPRHGGGAAAASDGLGLHEEGRGHGGAAAAASEGLCLHEEGRGHGGGGGGGVSWSNRSAFLFPYGPSTLSDLYSYPKDLVFALLSDTAKGEQRKLNLERLSRARSSA